VSQHKKKQHGSREVEETGEREIERERQKEREKTGTIMKYM
jgi:hypothetical protein